MQCMLRKREDVVHVYHVTDTYNHCNTNSCAHDQGQRKLTDKKAV